MMSARRVMPSLKQGMRGSVTMTVAELTRVCRRHSPDSNKPASKFSPNIPKGESISGVRASNINSALKDSQTAFRGRHEQTGPIADHHQDSGSVLRPATGS